MVLAESHVIKLKCRHNENGEDIRLVLLSRESTWDELEMKLKKLFRLDRVRLRYEDADGTILTVESQEDLDSLLTTEVGTVNGFVTGSSITVSSDENIVDRFASQNTHSSHYLDPDRFNSIKEQLPDLYLAENIDSSPLKTQGHLVSGLIHEDSSHSDTLSSHNNQSDGVSDFALNSLVMANTSDIVKWKKGQRLGSGAFGVVYQGLNMHTGELIAVKQLDTRVTSRKDILSIQDEISLLRSLQHENIITYYGTEYDDAAKTFSIFLEYAPGGSLRQLLDRFGVLEESVVRTYTRQILLGLEYLHRNGIAHRDIKSGNVLLGVNGVIKLADFGQAKRHGWNSQSSNNFANISKFDDGRHTTTESGGLLPFGTPNYTAPEVILSSRSHLTLETPITKGSSASTVSDGNEEKSASRTTWRKSDIWSVGCTVIELLTGTPPFTPEGGQTAQNPLATLVSVANAKEPLDIPQSLSPLARDFVISCMRVDPRARPDGTLLLMHPFVAAPAPTSLPHSLHPFSNFGYNFNFNFGYSQGTVPKPPPLSSISESVDKNSPADSAGGTAWVHSGASSSTQIDGREKAEDMKGRLGTSGKSAKSNSVTETTFPAGSHAASRERDGNIAVPMIGLSNGFPFGGYDKPISALMLPRPQTSDNARVGRPSLRSLPLPFPPSSFSSSAQNSIVNVPFHSRGSNSISSTSVNTSNSQLPRPTPPSPPRSGSGIRSGSDAESSSCVPLNSSSHHHSSVGPTASADKSDNRYSSSAVGESSVCVVEPSMDLDSTIWQSRVVERIASARMRVPSGGLRRGISLQRGTLHMGDVLRVQSTSTPRGENDAHTEDDIGREKEGRSELSEDIDEERHGKEERIQNEEVSKKQIGADDVNRQPQEFTEDHSSSKHNPPVIVRSIPLGTAEVIGSEFRESIAALSHGPDEWDFSGGDAHSHLKDESHSPLPFVNDEPHAGETSTGGVKDSDAAVSLLRGKSYIQEDGEIPDLDGQPSKSQNVANTVSTNLSSDLKRAALNQQILSSPLRVDTHPPEGGFDEVELGSDSRVGSFDSHLSKKSFSPPFGSVSDDGILWHRNEQRGVDVNGGKVSSLDSHSQHYFSGSKSYSHGYQSHSPYNTSVERDSSLLNERNVKNSPSEQPRLYGIDNSVLDMSASSNHSSRQMTHYSNYDPSRNSPTHYVSLRGHGSHLTPSSTLENGLTPRRFHQSSHPLKQAPSPRLSGLRSSAQSFINSLADSVASNRDINSIENPNNRTFESGSGALSHRDEVSFSRISEVRRDLSDDLIVKPKKKMPEGSMVDKSMRFSHQNLPSPSTPSPTSLMNAYFSFDSGTTNAGPEWKETLIRETYASGGPSRSTITPTPIHSMSLPPPTSPYVDAGSFHTLDSRLGNSVSSWHNSLTQSASTVEVESSKPHKVFNNTRIANKSGSPKRPVPSGYLPEQDLVNIPIPTRIPRPSSSCTGTTNSSGSNLNSISHSYSSTRFNILNEGSPESMPPAAYGSRKPSDTHLPPVDSMNEVMHSMNVGSKMRPSGRNSYKTQSNRRSLTGGVGTSNSTVAQVGRVLAVVQKKPSRSKDDCTMQSSREIVRNSVLSESNFTPDHYTGERSSMNTRRGNVTGEHQRDTSDITPELPQLPQSHQIRRGYAHRIPSTVTSSVKSHVPFPDSTSVLSGENNEIEEAYYQRHRYSNSSHRNDHIVRSREGDVEQHQRSTLPGLNGIAIRSEIDTSAVLGGERNGRRQSLNSPLRNWNEITRESDLFTHTSFQSSGGDNVPNTSSKQDKVTLPDRKSKVFSPASAQYGMRGGSAEFSPTPGINRLNTDTHSRGSDSSRTQPFPRKIRSSSQLGSGKLHSASSSVSLPHPQNSIGGQVSHSKESEYPPVQGQDAFRNSSAYLGKKYSVSSTTHHALLEKKEQTVFNKHSVTRTQESLQLSQRAPLVSMDSFSDYTDSIQSNNRISDGGYASAFVHRKALLANLLPSSPSGETLSKLRMNSSTFLDDDANSADCPSGSFVCNSHRSDDEFSSVSRSRI